MSSEEEKAEMHAEPFSEPVANVVYHGMMFLINAPLHYLLSGITLVILWRLVIVPQFDVDEITLMQAIGVLVFVHFLKRRRRDKEEQNETYLERFVLLVLFNGTMLLIGYVVNQFL